MTSLGGVRGVRRGLTALVLLVVAGPLAACGADDAAEGERSEASPSSAAPSSEGASAEPSASPTASASLATGRLVTQGPVSVHAVEGWDREVDDRAPFKATYFSRTRDQGVSLTVMELPLPVSLRQLRASTVRNLPGPAPTVLPDAELDGCAAYHIRSRTLRMSVDQFGLQHDDQMVQLDVYLPRDTEPAERDRIVESVRATLELG